MGCQSREPGRCGLVQAQLARSVPGCLGQPVLVAGHDERIKQVFRDFRDKVAQCRDKDTTTADIQDAYSRLHRFRDRYLHEVQSPDPTERATVRKVFEGHNFINCGSPARFRSVANNATALVNLSLIHI